MLWGPFLNNYNLDIWLNILYRSIVSHLVIHALIHQSNTVLISVQVFEAAWLAKDDSLQMSLIMACPLAGDTKSFPHQMWCIMNSWPHLNGSVLISCRGSSFWPTIVILIHNPELMAVGKNCTSTLSVSPSSFCHSKICIISLNESQKHTAGF